MLLDLKNLIDSGAVPKMNFKEVKELTDLEWFNYDTIKTKNTAAAGLCSFVVNIVIYYEITTTVEPKRKALAEANEQLDRANAQLKEVNETVAILEAKLSKLTTELNAANKEKQDAMDAVELSLIHI